MSTELQVVGVGEIVDAAAIEIGRLYKKAGQTTVEAVNYYIECGQRLAEKKATMKHGEWLPWLADNAAVLGFDSDRTARMLMKAANRKLTSDLDEAVKISREIWGNSQPANYSSESVEWYTPARYLECVRAVLGGIDLDPASNALANETIGAAEFYSEEMDGLSREWRGRVFMNPPYGVANGESVAGLFCRKAVDEYFAGRVSAAIILVNSSHSQKWQSLLYDFPICFVDHRICFVSGHGTENENPTFQNIFVYLGAHVSRFAREFQSLGYVMEPVDG